MKYDARKIKAYNRHYVIAVMNVKNEYSFLHESAGCFLGDLSYATVYNSAEEAIEKMEEARRDLNTGWGGFLTIVPFELKLTIAATAEIDHPAATDMGDRPLLAGRYVV